MNITYEDLHVVAIDADGCSIFEDSNNPGEPWNSGEHFLTLEGC